MGMPEPVASHSQAVRLVEHKQGQRQQPDAVHRQDTVKGSAQARSMPEVVAPLGQAVRLIEDDKGQGQQALQRSLQAGALQAFWGDEQDLQLPRLNSSGLSARIWFHGSSWANRGY